MQPLWNHKFSRRVGLASRTLGNGHQRVAGPDDAVQSAFLSFWQQAEAGTLHGEFHRDNLWVLLSVITVRKAQKQIRKETAALRGGKRKRIGLAEIIHGHLMEEAGCRDVTRSVSEGEP